MIVILLGSRAEQFTFPINIHTSTFKFVWPEIMEEMLNIEISHLLSTSSFWHSLNHESAWTLAKSRVKMK